MIRVNDQRPALSALDLVVNVTEGEPDVLLPLADTLLLNVTDGDGENLQSASAELLGSNVSPSAERLTAAGFTPTDGGHRIVFTSPGSVQNYQVSKTRSFQTYTRLNSYHLILQLYRQVSHNVVTMETNAIGWPL